MAEVKEQPAQHPERHLQVEKVVPTPSDGFSHARIQLFDRNGQCWVVGLEALEAVALARILDKTVRYLGAKGRRSLESEAQKKYPDVFDSSEKRYEIMY